jgi:hypothetical protein
MRFLLFVKEKLPFGEDPEKDKWISAQATRFVEAWVPVREDRLIKPDVIEIVRWRGLHFASSVYVTPFPSFRHTVFADAR